MPCSFETHKQQSKDKTQMQVLEKSPKLWHQCGMDWTLNTKV